MSVTEIFSKQKALELVDTKNEYPIDALPKIIKNAVTSYQSYGQQPLSMIACSALASVSLVCQALANVARDKLLISPTSLYFLVVADSGERKSASDSVFRQAINEWELKTRKKLQKNWMVIIYYKI